jgi:hypothetical protein
MNKNKSLGKKPTRLVGVPKDAVWIDTDCMGCDSWPLPLVKTKDINAVIVECPYCGLRFTTIGVHPSDENEFLELAKCDKCATLVWYAIEGSLSSNPYIGRTEDVLCRRCRNG